MFDTSSAWMVACDFALCQPGLPYFLLMYRMLPLHNQWSLIAVQWCKSQASLKQRISYWFWCIDPDVTRALSQMYTQRTMFVRYTAVPIGGAPGKF